MKFNTFYYTKIIDGVTTHEIDVELPGVDPSSLKLTQSEGRMYLNDIVVVSGLASKFLDLEATTAQLKHGLLTIKIPEKKPTRTPIPITLG